MSPCWIPLRGFSDMFGLRQYRGRRRPRGTARRRPSWGSQGNQWYIITITVTVTITITIMITMLIISVIIIIVTTL